MSKSNESKKRNWLIFRLRGMFNLTRTAGFTIREQHDVQLIINNRLEELGAKPEKRTI